MSPSRSAARRSPSGSTRRCPTPPDSMQALRSLVGEDNYPQVFNALRPTPDLGPAARGHRPRARRRRHACARSVVKVEGWRATASRTAAASWSDTDLVVTNAHVVAGERETDVHPRRRQPGRRPRSWPSTPTATSPCCGCPGSTARRCRIGRASLQAHRRGVRPPGGGPLRVAPFAVANRLRATGRDIYGTGLTDPRHPRAAQPAAPRRLGLGAGRPDGRGGRAWPSPSPPTSRTWPTRCRPTSCGPSWPAAGPSGGHRPLHRPAEPGRTRRGRRGPRGDGGRRRLRRSR